MKYIVKKEYTSDNNDPIVLKKGDLVFLGDKSNDNGPWPNWIYCTSDRTKKCGWTPVQILQQKGDTAIATEDYDAIEMTVRVGDILSGDRILNGWVWCIRASDNSQAWVPLNCVEAINH